VVVGDVLVVE
jgi:hypothetical protein